MSVAIHVSDEFRGFSGSDRKNCLYSNSVFFKKKCFDLYQKKFRLFSVIDYFRHENTNALKFPTFKNFSRDCRTGFFLCLTSSPINQAFSKVCSAENCKLLNCKF